MKVPLPLIPWKVTWSKLGIFFVLTWGIGLWFFMNNQDVIAQEPGVPWECSEYSGDAQTRCMKTLLELQEDKIAKLEERLKAQEGTVNELKNKIDRQADLSRRENRSFSPYPRYSPQPYVRSYAPYYGYAPLIPPIGVYLGIPWRYPRYYYGYGPGYWGPPGLSFNFRFGGKHRHRHR